MKKSCNYCRAYLYGSSPCLLKFKTKLLKKEKQPLWYGSIYKRCLVEYAPDEKCTSPKTKRYLVKDMKSRGIL